MDSVLSSPWLAGVLLAFVFVALYAALKGGKQEGQSAQSGGGVPLGPHEVERYIGDNLTAIGRNQFPDNPEEDWELLQVKQDSDFVMAEVKPATDEVGYERFVFCFPAHTTGTPQPVATFCFENGSYEMLSYSSKVKRATLPQSVPF